MTTPNETIEYLRQRERALYAELVRAQRQHEEAVQALQEARVSGQSHPMMEDILERFKKGAKP